MATSFLASISPQVHHNAARSVHHIQAVSAQGGSSQGHSERFTATAARRLLYRHHHAQHKCHKGPQPARKQGILDTSLCKSVAAVVMDTMVRKEAHDCHQSHVRGSSSKSHPLRQPIESQQSLSQSVSTQCGEPTGNSASAKKASSLEEPQHGGSSSTLVAQVVAALSLHSASIDQHACNPKMHNSTGLVARQDPHDGWQTAVSLLAPIN